MFKYHLFGMCQSNVCKIAKNIAEQIELKLCPKFINFFPKQSSQCMDLEFVRNKKIFILLAFSIKQTKKINILLFFSYKQSNKIFLIQLYIYRLIFREHSFVRLLVIDCHDLKFRYNLYVSEFRSRIRRLGPWSKKQFNFEKFEITIQQHWEFR